MEHYIPDFLPFFLENRMERMRALLPNPKLYFSPGDLTKCFSVEAKFSVPNSEVLLLSKSSPKEEVPLRETIRGSINHFNILRVSDDLKFGVAP